MGLDQYLYMEVKAPRGSPLAKVIEENWTEMYEGQVLPDDDEEPGYVPMAYISGWSHPAMNDRPAVHPDRLFTAIAEEILFTPHSGSPHFMVSRDTEGTYTVSGTLYYWRKANSIHRWFVDTCQNGVDDCGEYEVHAEQLIDLIDRCERVTLDHDLASELLPSQGGFFFGSTDYDDWYFRDLEETAVELKAQLMVCPRGARLMYHSSW